MAGKDHEIYCVLTNDDGFTKMLEITYSILNQVTKKTIVIVPDKNRTGTSSSLTLNEPVSIRNGIKSSYIPHLKIVSGFPTDGLRYTLRNSFPEANLIISGINLGYNLGYSIINSGTVGAALEGIRYGINSICLSTDHDFEDISENWISTVREILKKLAPIATIKDYGPIILNINLPVSFSSVGTPYKILPVSKIQWNEWYETNEEKGNFILRGDVMKADNNIPDIASIDSGYAVINIIPTAWTTDYAKIETIVNNLLTH